MSKENTAEKKPNLWLFFIIISFALLMMTIDSTIVATALHDLQVDLDTTVSWAGWTLTAYSFGFILMLPLSAKLSTQFGHRRIFMISVFVFTLSSLICGLSENIYFLIVMRIIQAIGGAGLTPSATGLIVEHFGKARNQFLGLFGSIFSSGALLGPIFGGLIVTYFTWHWIFFINIPFGLAVMIFAMRIIPKDHQTERTRKGLDFKGVILMAVALLSFMYGVTYLGEKNQPSLSFTTLGCLALATVSFIWLFRHLKRAKAPLIQTRFIYGKGFGAVNLYNIIHSGMVIGANALVPLYATNRYGLDELHAGTLLVGNGLASVVLSIIMSIYLNRTGYRRPLFIGGLFLVVGVGLLFIMPPFDITPFIWLMSCTFLIGTGMGIMSPAGRNAGISLAPDFSANIAAVRSMGLQFGQIITISGATAIIAGSQNLGMTQAFVYVGLAGFLLITLFVIVPRVPEIKGAW